MDKKLTPAEMFSRAMVIASVAHMEQQDKGGNPYITHPMRVMNTVATYRDYELMAVAILHDVYEDTDKNIGHLLDEGFSERVYDALFYLTHRKEQSYEQYIEMISRNRDATLVKLADLKDNSDISRMKGLREKDFDRIIKYNKAYAYLTEKLKEKENA
jgi:(p)ppGpp synthase/HD superfamily hydrolase